LNAKSWTPNPTAHGGGKKQGRRKTARPISTKTPMHLVLRSSRARGEWSLLRKQSEVESELHKTAKKFRIRVYKLANVGNHLHLLVQARRREDFQNFLRVFTQGVVFLVTRARKGNPIGKFWDKLAFSRVVDWGTDWRGMLTYLEKNILEGRGMPRDRVDWWFGWKREISRGGWGL
jgi:REP element-mobilizing transposase RayT